MFVKLVYFFHASFLRFCFLFLCFTTEQTRKDGTDLHSLFLFFVSGLVASTYMQPYIHSLIQVCLNLVMESIPDSLHDIYIHADIHTFM